MIFGRKDNDPKRALFDRIMEDFKKSERDISGTRSGANRLRDEVIAMEPKERAEFLVKFPGFLKRLPTTNSMKDWRLKQYITEFYSDLIRRKNDFTNEQLLELVHLLKRQHRSNFGDWPIGWIVNQLGKSIKAYDLTEETRIAWFEVSKWEEFSQENYYGADLKKARSKLVQLVADDSVVAEYSLGNTNLAKSIKTDLATMSREEQNQWHKSFFAAARATGSKPSKKFTEPINAVIDEIGTARFKKQVGLWLDEAARAKSFYIEGNEDHYDHGRPDSEIQNLLKGLVWSMARFHDADSLSSIARLTEKCFDRLPGVGPAAAGIGNAAIYTLGNSKGLAGVAHLSRLKLRIKQNNTQKLIQKNIEEQAAKLGLKSAEIEDMAAPDFGLVHGVRDFKFDDYTLRLEALGVGQAVLNWIKPDGSPQKSVPSFVKEKAVHKKKLADIRALAKDIKKASTAQRDRIDRLYTEDMSWEPEAFHKYYLGHGLIGPMAHQLIWWLTMEKGEHAALFTDGQWQDVAGEIITGTPEKIQLWHPIMSDTNTVLAWRARLEALLIKQPFKQTFREIYLLTDAEINTKTYSNRMAAHLLKQHQFNSLAAIRGWKYSLLGAYDDGRDNEIAQKPLPSYGLTAELWIDELHDMTDSFNDAGIWDYVATDQVRFTSETDDAVDLIDVPAIILSEVLRDTDLFVGVASIGNDPNWSDRGGAPRTNEYWQDYSFGDLSETAKTRKTVLESLLPRLKIRDVAKIEGKFLVVQGSRHTYKIHIGSANILIAPQDKYLCIVPGRGKDKNVDKLFLPFEGDRGLAIVLSKAFLLAADDKIDDPTILSQL